jgi:Protein of unknown function (DUF3293)
MMNSGIDTGDANTLWAAYRRTVYATVVDGRELHIRVDRTTPDLDAELSKRGVTTWAFITACNPRSQPLPPAENEARQDRLREELRRAGFAIANGEGRAPDGDWTPEASLLVLGIAEPDALAVGGRYGQLAIVVGRQHGPARLVACGKSEWCRE